MNRYDRLQTLCETPGISGNESLVRRYFEAETGDGGDLLHDNMGQVLWRHRGDDDKPAILFLAHMDEVGFIVADITAAGMLKVQNIGGWDPRTLMAGAVEVFTSDGRCHFGVFGSVPMHFLADKSKLEIKDLFVDIGAASYDEALNDFGICLGDAIVPKCFTHTVPDKRRLFSKAFDDRAGLGAILELTRTLAEREHPNTVYCGGSVQEEVGLRGAQVITSLVQPDVAFIIEGPPADDTLGLSRPQACVGKGVHLRAYDPGMLVRRELKDWVAGLAAEHDISVQITVRRRGGTDGGRVHLAHSGVPSIVLGVPVRYAHSHHGLISLDDYDNLISLLVHIAATLDKAMLQRILG
ncbi:MAG: M42 family metallopeptidase [Candidatus Cloacimonetes bacterium]|nr:M42 family metallopeptidase [Candidatus Cloacimonadota bacterium]